MILDGAVSNLRQSSVNNNQVNRFSQELKEFITNSGIDNLKYIDLGDSDLTILGYDSSGMHYGRNDYRNIYDIIFFNR